jgi:hypothetical protein
MISEPAPRLLPFTTRTRWIIIVVFVVIVAPLLWLGVRAYIAYDALLNAEADVGSLQSAITTNHLDALPYIYSDMSGDTETAAALTSDPVWRAAEHLPVVGSNLAAVRQVAHAVNSLVVQGVGPLASQAKGLNLGQFRPTDGKVNLAKIESYLPVIDTAAHGVDSAQSQINAIDISHTVGPVRNAITTLRGLLGTASSEVAQVKSVFALVPPALGSDGPRNYLVVLGTNSQDRAVGGAASSLALVRIDNGKLSIVREEPASAVVNTVGGKSVPLADNELTPNFPTTARTIAAAWTATFHDKVDDVVSIDTTGLGYLATPAGSVSVSADQAVAADDLATYLDSDVYTKHLSDSAIEQQRATALDGVLSNVIAGRGSTPAYLTAASQLVNEKRLTLWSARSVEQKFIATTPFGGTLTTSNDKVTTYGVFFNEATGAPTSPELTASAALEPIGCSSLADGTSQISVTLESTGTSPIHENVLVYGPAHFEYESFSSQGGTVTETALPTVGTRPVEQFAVTVNPGKTVVFNVKHSQGGPTPSKTVEIRTSSRWQVTQLNLNSCS